jgi:hypothetical protein
VSWGSRTPGMPSSGSGSIRAQGRRALLVGQFVPDGPLVRRLFLGLPPRVSVCLHAGSHVERPLVVLRITRMTKGGSVAVYTRYRPRNPSDAMTYGLDPTGALETATSEHDVKVYSLFASNAHSSLARHTPNPSSRQPIWDFDRGK